MNNKTQNKIQITQSIIQAASVYKTKMVGYVFLYVFEGRYIEVIYRAKDFMHLTGVDSNLSSIAFYREAVKGNLRHNQIYFSQRHPYDLCVQKMTQLQNISAATNSGIFMLENLATDTFTYKFGLTELNFTLCLKKDVDTLGNVVSDKYVVRSLRVEDSVSRSSDAYEVQYIFAKRNDERLYNVLKYRDKRYDISSLPQNILNKLDISLFNEDK
ncbi:MAG: hypothetical protein J6N52_12930 [Clostridia bacterium]|nr:hypothetical protein [Clostridia bacterium]